MENQYAAKIERVQIKPYCTIQDAELITGESRTTLIRRIAKGDLRAYKRSGSGRWTIKQEDLQSYLGL
tara:strand:+ start:207 stop:410 length:204 start_codon:yes stop_codon:yes gene_type:complete